MSLNDNVGVVYDARFLRHVPGNTGCVEVPARLEAIVDSLRSQGLWDRLQPIDITPASPRQLTWAHTREYVESVQQECRDGLTTISQGDTDVCGASFEVAALAAGGCMSAVREVMAGKVRSAICLVRPPGHHATADRGMGFCLFNNAALAAQQARRVGKARRVLILDWDLHHANGTQEIFYEDPGVFLCSLHQDGEYPMPERQIGYARESGQGAGEGMNLNCPLPPGAGDAAALNALNERLVPAMQAYQPELVIVSCGLDCLKGDPLGRLEITIDGLAAMTRVARDIADEYAQGRLVSILEGGYNFALIGPAMCAHVQALMER